MSNFPKHIAIIMDGNGRWAKKYNRPRIFGHKEGVSRVNEIVEFCNEYQRFSNRVPLVVVPSTYSHKTEDDLQDLGVNVVIYANHLLRSAYPAMIKTAQTILENSRAQEASEEYCMSIKDIITLVPETP